MSKRKKKADHKNALADQRGNSFFHYRKDLICIVLLFVLAWFLRSQYQTHSVTRAPLGSDAGKYARAAYNLRFHRVYSLDPPSPVAPFTRTDVPPGFPVFLTFFFVHTIDAGWQFDIDQMRSWQVLMGSVVAVLTFALARQALSRGWSLLAGFLTCISPHLIVISDYVLTESLFTVIMIAGTWILAVAWRHPRVWLIFLGSFMLALSSEVRLISLAMPFFLAPLFFFRANQSGQSDRKMRMMAVVAILTGFLCVQALHGAFVSVAVANADEIQKDTKKYSRLKAPWEYLAHSVRPPNYYVQGRSHIAKYNPNRQSKQWKRRTTASFSEEPLAYLRWNLYGRTIVFWHFDNGYIGDVYIYQMSRKGFLENTLLNRIHSLMRLLHWPLYALALAGVVLLAVGSWRGTLPVAARALWAPALGFSYFLAVLTAMAWLPRYSIPARPFSYVMVAACLAFLAAWVKDKLAARHRGG